MPVEPVDELLCAAHRLSAGVGVRWMSSCVWLTECLLVWGYGVERCPGKLHTTSHRLGDMLTCGI